jgi:nucleoid DNA-binding protein
MNKQELIKTLAKKFELTNTKSEEIIKYTLESITASLFCPMPSDFSNGGDYWKWA